MKALFVTPDAETDLQGIWRYTRRTWGLAQADRYLSEIDDRMTGLVNGHTPSRSADDIRPGLRRAFAGRHVLFFRDTADTITVIRVLHQSQDFGRLR